MGYLFLTVWGLLLCQFFPLFETFQIQKSHSLFTSSKSQATKPIPSFIQSPSYDRITTSHFASIGGDRWAEFLQQSSAKVIGPTTLLNHYAESKSLSQTSFSATRSPQKSNRDPWAVGNERDLVDPIEQRKKQEFHCNLGKAIDTLQTQLPMVFYLPNLDFSIFGDYILVSDNRQNKITMSKNLYMTVIRSIQMAASFSKIYPSLNLQKIDYSKELETIQCRVQIVLPDSIRIEGQSIWEGMFYFGVDDRGLINSHIFDPRVPLMRPDPIPSKSSYPWLNVNSLLDPRPDRPIPGTVFGTTLADRISSMFVVAEVSDSTAIEPANQ